MIDIISENFKDHIFLMNRISEEFSDKILRISKIIIDAYQKDKKVLTAGNGGSAADAQHIVGELVNKFYHDRRALSAIALSTDTTVLTSWANDKSYDSVFERQIEAHGNPGDVFIAISTSGNSQNVINAVKKAKKKDIITIGLLGRDGGELEGLCDYKIVVPSFNVGRIQEAHEFIYHNICQIVEEYFLK